MEKTDGNRRGSEVGARDEAASAVELAAWDDGALAVDAATQDDGTSTSVSTDSAASRRTRMLKGAFFVFLSAVCWGCSGTCVEYLTSTWSVPVAWIVSVRLTCGALILMPVLYANRTHREQFRELLRDKVDVRRLIVYGICGSFACQIGYLFAINYTDAGTGTMMEQLGLVIVVIVNYAMARRWPSARILFGVVLAMAGMYCLCMQGQTSLSMPPEGLAWGIFSAFAMASYILLPVKLLEKYHEMVVTAPSMVVAMLFAIAFVQPWRYELTMNLPVVLALAGSVLLGTVAAYLLFLRGVKLAGPVIGGLLDSFEPVAALVCSAICLGTLVTGWDIAGCVLIVSMIVLVTLPEKGAGACAETSAAAPDA